MVTMEAPSLNVEVIMPDAKTGVKRAAGISGADFSKRARGEEQLSAPLAFELPLFLT